MVRWGSLGEVGNLHEAETFLGLFDRDWYWQQRAERKSPDDDYLFPNHRWPGRKSTVYPTAIAVLAVLAFLLFGVHQGWFDRDWRSHAERVEAENKALRAWDSTHPRGVQSPNVAPPRAAPPVPTFHEKHRLPIEFTLLGLMILSPFVLLALLAGLFMDRLRGCALIGLVLGLAAGHVCGTLFVSGAWFRWGLLYPADSMGGAFQFLEVITASFAIAAIAGAIAIFVLARPRQPS